MQDDLRALYPPILPVARDKQLDRLDAHCIAFIRRSPFLVLATTDGAGGCDASPRGDMPGFVEVLDDQTLAIPDRRGNNRLDSLGNIARSPGLGLLFMVPGVIETLRVNGRGALSAEAGLLARMAVEGKAPASALVVTVEEAFFHCGKALKRAALWDPARHARPGEIPSLGRILADQIRGVDAAEADANLAVAYRERLY